MRSGTKDPSVNHCPLSILEVAKTLRQTPGDDDYLGWLFTRLEES